MNAANNRKTSRDGTLDFLKIIATILILFHHYQQYNGVTFQHPLINFYGGRFYFGYTVEFFFVISGFLMFKYVDKIKEGESFSNFYLKRVLRLLPLQAVAAIVYYILEKLVDTQHIFIEYIEGIKWPEPTIYGTVLDILGIQSGWASEDPMINSPTWYVSVLLLCCIVFYVVTSFCQRKNIDVHKGYLIVALIGIAAQFFHINLPFINSSSARGYASFFTGVILADYIQNRETNKKITNIVAILIFVVSIPCIILGVPGLIYGLTLFTYPSIIILLNNFKDAKFFNSPALQKWGGYQFDAYIWHICIIIVLKLLDRNNVINIDFRTPWMMLIFVAIVELLAVGSYYWIEKPLNKLADKCYYWIISEKQ